MTIQDSSLIVGEEDEDEDDDEESTNDVSLMRITEDSLSSSRLG